MPSISIQFQLNDQQPTLVDLPVEFTLKDFKKAADSVCNNQSLFYTLVCHGKELNLHNEDQFNEYKSLITCRTTIFIDLPRTKGCFLSDTLVQRADRSEISISDIQVGDVVLAFTNSGEIVNTIVENVFIHEVNEYIEVKFGQNRLFVTPEHPFYVGNGKFCSLDKLRIDDCIYNLIDDNLHPTSIINIKTIKAPGTCVYNLRTGHPHTYFVNGIAVHNKLGTTFVDLNNDKGLQRIKWSSDAPRWRVARPGICLDGKCDNQYCLAYRQQVIINIGIKKFDLLTESIDASKCPECTQYVEPVTCAFNNCYWRWNGQFQYANHVGPKAVSGDWKHADDAYHRFDEIISGSILWRQLIIEAKAQ